MEGEEYAKRGTAVRGESDAFMQRDLGSSRGAVMSRETNAPRMLGMFERISCPSEPSADELGSSRDKPQTCST